MAGKEGLNPKYAPQQIEELQKERMKAASKAIEGGAQILFSSDQIERVRREMQKDKLTPEERSRRFWQEFGKFNEFFKQLKINLKNNKENSF